MSKSFKLSFEEAKEYIQSLNLSSKNHFSRWSSSGQRPSDIPSNPAKFYKNRGWKGWGDFLGTGTISNRYYQFRSFEEARVYVHNLKLFSATQYKKWAKTSERPIDIPANPYSVYLLKGWTNWGDFLGTGNVAYSKRQYMTYKEAKAFVQSLGITSIEEYEKMMKSPNKPQNLPYCPYEVYALRGWTNWGDFLGTGNKAPSDYQFRSFEEARAYVCSLGFNSKTEYVNWLRSPESPDDLPTHPQDVYRHKGWSGFADFLGTKNKDTTKRQFKSYEEACDYVQLLFFEKVEDFIKWTRTDERPLDIPTSPYSVYKNKGWTNWGDWLGTGRSNKQKKRKLFLTFEEARKYIHTQKFKSANEYKAWVRDTENNDIFPLCPNLVYRNGGWKGWADFLGNNKRPVYKGEWRSFEEARAYVRSLKLNSLNEYKEWAKTAQRPDDIPASPYRIYKGNGWISSGDWLGTEYIDNKERKFKTYEEARSYIQSLGFKTQKEYCKWAKSEQRPDDIPGCPSKIYKHKGWQGWGDFLGTGNISRLLRQWRSFKEARSFVRTLKLHSSSKYFKWARSNNCPSDIPRAPHMAYQGKGWTNWIDFLGTQNISVNLKQWRAFEEARAFVHTLGLKNNLQYKEWAKTSQKPDDIPANPYLVYKNKGWINWGNWLGTGTIAASLKRFRSFKDARKYVRTIGFKSRSEYVEWARSKKCPVDLPRAPHVTYKDKGWKGWSDWLDKSKK